MRYVVEGNDVSYRTWEAQRVRIAKGVGCLTQETRVQHAFRWRGGQYMTKCVKVLRSKSKAISMDQSQARIKPFQTVPTRIRACDWSMLFAFAFARNTLTHLVICQALPGRHRGTA